MLNSRRAKSLLYLLQSLGGIHVAQHNAECCVLAGPGTGLVSAQHSQHYEQYSVVLYLLPGRDPAAFSRQIFGVTPTIALH